MAEPGQQETQNVAKTNPLSILLAAFGIIALIVVGIIYLAQKPVQVSQVPVAKQEQVAPADPAPAPVTEAKTKWTWVSPGVVTVEFNLEDFGAEFKIADLKRDGIDLTKDSKFIRVDEFMDDHMKESWKVTNPSVLMGARVNIRGTHTLWKQGALGTTTVSGQVIKITVNTTYSGPGRHFVTLVPEVYIATSDGKTAKGWGDYAGYSSEQFIVRNAYNWPQWGLWIDNDQKKVDVPGAEGLKIAKSRK
jgi:hypothetical protein